MFVRWWRMQEEDRPQVWLLYGWFSGLMFLGSVFGAVAWGAYSQFLVLLFKSFALGLSKVQLQSLNAQSQYWFAAFAVTYALEFLCLSVAKLLVLHRMTNFAVAKGDGMSRRFAVGGRVMMATVVLGNALGFCGNVATAVAAKKCGDAFNSAAAAFAANKTDLGIAFSKLAVQKISDVNDVVSVQQFSEVAVLLIIIVAFTAVGAASARRVSSALRNMNDEHGAAGRQLRRQIVGTTAFVFVTFLLRAVFSIMNAVSNVLQNLSSDCADPYLLNLCDPSCFNMWDLMQWWLEFTPEFMLTVVLISSPLALLVALWGMTSKRALRLMATDRRQMGMASLVRQGPVS
jgi:hypothetical protein